MLGDHALIDIPIPRASQTMLRFLSSFHLSVFSAEIPTTLWLILERNHCHYCITNLTCKNTVHALTWTDSHSSQGSKNNAAAIVLLFIRASNTSDAKACSRLIKGPISIQDSMLDSSWKLRGHFDKCLFLHVQQLMLSVPALSNLTVLHRSSNISCSEYQLYKLASKFFSLSLGK